MTETEALTLLNTALGLIAQLGSLAPQLASNWQSVKDGLASNDAEALNAQIANVHQQVQDMDARLQALKA
jgi:hypothetical protein